MPVQWASGQPLPQISPEHLVPGPEAGWVSGREHLPSFPPSPPPLDSALQLLTVLKCVVSLLQGQFLTLFSSLSLSLSLSLSFPSPPLPVGPPRFLPAGGLPTSGREGRMVVLSLVLGLSEQDDFANIPDLQNPGTQQNQNAQGDKRYEHRRGPAAAAAETEAWRSCQPPPALARLLDEAAVPSAILEREDCLLPSWCPHTRHPGVSLGSEASVAVLGPFWIKPAPQACLPSPGASQPFCPISLLGSPHPLLPLIFHLCPTPDPEIPVSLVVGGRGGCREGPSACSPSSLPPQPPSCLEVLLG